VAYARIFLILCLINLVVGCAKQNGAIKARPNEIKLIIGETTKEDLIGWFGAQSKVIALENGNETHEFVIKGNNMKGGVLVGSVTGVASGTYSGLLAGAALAPATLGASLVIGPIIGAGVGVGIGLLDSALEDNESYPVQILISEFNSQGESVDFKYRAIEY